MKYEKRDGIGVITLQRPERLNALTFEVYAALRDRFAELEREDDVRVVVLTGAGRAFCSGGDVKEIIGPLLNMNGAQLLDFTRLTCDVVRNMRRLRKPIIAAVNGVATGAGAVLAAAADFRICSDTARFAFLFTRVGLSGADMGAAFLLPRLVGFARATELLMLGDFFDASEALRIGFVHKVTTADRLEAETMALADRLKAAPALGLAVTKEMLNRETAMSLEQALEAEAIAQAVCMQTADFREAYRAFIEKREPKFNQG